LDTNYQITTKDSIWQVCVVEILLRSALSCVGLFLLGRFNLFFGLLFSRNGLSVMFSLFFTFFILLIDSGILLLGGGESARLLPTPAGSGVAGGGGGGAGADTSAGCGVTGGGGGGGGGGVDY
jgi:hypothetical protein